MKIKRKNKKIITLALVVAALIVGSVGWYTFGLQRDGSTPSSDESSNSSSETSTNDASLDTNDAPAVTDTDSSDKPSEADSPVGGETDNNPTPSDPNQASFSVGFTHLQQEDSTLHVRTVISSTLPGNCTLVLEKAGNTVTRKAATQVLPNNSTCKGFSIPSSQLSTGSWNATLTVTINGETASTKKTVTIN